MAGIHDPLCSWPLVCNCNIIARVRADERARWQPLRPTTPHHAAFCWCPTCTDHDPEDRP